MGEARCEELTRAMWAAAMAALPKVAGKQRTHAETVARNRFKKAVAQGDKDGLSRDDMIDLIDEALVKGIMER